MPSLDDPEAVRLFIDERAQIFQQVLPLAMRNLAIAQHRDKTQFRLVSGPPWDRAKEEVALGEFVLVKRKPLASLDIPTDPHILQVVRKKASGVVVLQGQDGERIEE